MQPKLYWTGISDRLLESMIFGHCQSETRRLALLIARIMFGFFKMDVRISMAECKALGFDIKTIPLICAEIEKIGWFEMDYKTGPDGFIKVKRKLGFILYNDEIKPYLHDLLIDIARKGKNYESKRND